MSNQSEAEEGKSRRRHPILFWPRRIQRPSVETIVIDSQSLVDFTQPTITTHPTTGTNHEVLDATRHALLESDSPRLAHLYSSLEPVLAQPAATYSGTLKGSSWHHGAHYNCYWFGDVTHILQRSDLTENEREHLQSAARRLGSEGKIVYAVATSTEPHTKTTNPHNFRPHDLNCLGLVSHDIRLYPDVARTLALFRQQGIKILYASHDNELLVSTIAHRAKLVSKLVLPEQFHPNIPLEHASSCYAELSREAHKKLIAQLDPHTTLVTNEPLPIVGQTIRVT